MPRAFLRALHWAFFILSVSPASADELTYPNSVMTPGAVDAPSEIFCRHRSKERRHLPPGLSDRIARAYGVPPDDIGVRYQLDHLVPLSIGGATTAENLWPQPMAKDVCDRELHDVVCVTGTVKPEVAQKAIADDWVKACHKLVGVP